VAGTHKADFEPGFQAKCTAKPQFQSLWNGLMLSPLPASVNRRKPLFSVFLWAEETLATSPCLEPVFTQKVSLIDSPIYLVINNQLVSIIETNE